MGLEHFNDKPDRVRRVIHSGEQDRIRAMAAKGGRESAKKQAKIKDEAEAVDDYWRQKVAEDEYIRKQSANEHIISPDGEDLDYKPSA